MVSLLTRRKQSQSARVTPRHHISRVDDPLVATPFLNKALLLYYSAVEMSHIRSVLLLLTIAACFQRATFQSRRRLKEGDLCRLENKLKGVCKLLNDCPAALEGLERENQKQPLSCSRGVNGTSIICCDESSNNKALESPNQQNKPDIANRTLHIEGQISRQKCDYYSKWIDIATLLGSGEMVKVAWECANIAQFILVNEPDPLEFPHMAHLGFDEGNKIKWECGGSLISEQYVLAAAHCLQKKDGTNVSHVRLGSSDPRTLQIVKIKELIPHPQYKRNHFYNDIALLKLEEEIEFANFKRPACLQVDHQFREDKGIASVWDQSENGRGSERLLKRIVPFVNNANCSSVYKAHAEKLSNSIDDRTQLCASTYEKGCQRDSGGPLQIKLKNPACMYSILGVTSFGRGCGQFPTVYTRVSAFVPWIEKQVWGEK